MPKPTPATLPPVRSFADACRQAMALSEDLEAPVHAAMCLGKRGEHRDLIAVTGWPADDIRSLAITVDGERGWDR